MLSDNNNVVNNIDDIKSPDSAPPAISTKLRGFEIPFHTPADKALYVKYRQEYAGFAKVSKGGKAYIVKEYTDSLGNKCFQFQSHRDFKDFHENDNFFVDDTVRGQTTVKRVYFAKMWLEESELSKRYIDCVFNPDPTYSSASYYNFWRGFVDRKPGNAAPFLEHINRLIVGPQEHKDYVVKLLAWVFQNPHLCPDVMLLLKGPQDCGKTTIFEFCAAMCPAHTYSTAKIKNILGFNAHTHHCKIIGLEEAFSDGDRATQNEFKHFITGKQRDIEGKGLDQKAVKNIIFYIATSNEERPVSIDNDDRRHAIFDCYVAGDKKYFEGLYDWLHNQSGASHMLDYLLSLDLTDFDRKKIPMTEAKAKVKQHSGNAVERFVFELLAGAYDEAMNINWNRNTQIVRSELFDLFTSQPRNNYGQSMFSSLLNKIFRFEEGWLDNWKESSGKRRRIYKFGTLDETRQAYAQHMKSTVKELFGAEASSREEEEVPHFDGEPIQVSLRDPGERHSRILHAQAMQASRMGAMQEARARTSRQAVYPHQPAS